MDIIQIVVEMTKRDSMDTSIHVYSKPQAATMEQLIAAYIVLREMLTNAGLTDEEISSISSMAQKNKLFVMERLN